eukprot:Nitzschia sp. Nitz4//scaffold489_size5144//2753//5083//NITZ4_009231-RA/size5144-processed-gene-0.2-mRNA-1//1//CDS//3329552900//2884//frame0
MAAESDGNQAGGGKAKPPKKPNPRKKKKHYEKKFQGSEPTLKGFIYDYAGERNPSQWIKTTKELKTYVARTFTKNTGDLLDAMDSLTLTDPVEPPEPENAQGTAAYRWNLEFKMYNEKLEQYKDFRTRMHGIVLGQCTPAMEERIRSHEKFPEVRQDGLKLLDIIMNILHAFESKQKIDVAMDEIQETYYTMHQSREMSLQKFYEMFTAHIKVMERVNCTFADQALIDSVATSNGRRVANDADREAAKKRAIATRFLRACNHKHQSYRTHLSDAFLDGNDHYPKTLHDVYNIMQRRQDTRGQYPENDIDEEGLTFTQNEETGVALATQGEKGADGNEPVPDVHGKTFADVLCYNCNHMGHYASSCPDKEAQGVNCCTTHGFSFSQPRFSIPKTWVLLDSQSTVDLFCNADLLTDIRPSTSHMNIHCNAGRRRINRVGELPGYGTVWYDPEAIANILSLRNVKTKYSVQFDSNQEGSFIVTKPDGETFHFTESQNGLYYLDTTITQPDETVLVNTVEDKRDSYTDADYSRAVIARKLLIKIGRPSIKDFKHIIQSRAIPNCPVTIRDVRMAEDIFGPDIGSLKGKTTRRRPHRVRSDFVQQLPPGVMQNYRDVTICGDLMHVNGITMLITVSRNIKFHTISVVNNKRTSTLLGQFRQLNKVYKRAGFRCCAALMDGAFESLRDGLATMGIVLNTTSRDEHVGEAERAIRTVKERMRAIYNTLPFRRIPTRLVIEAAKASVFWINALPNRNGLSKTLSPRTMVTGLDIDYGKHCQYEFG